MTQQSFKHHYVPEWYQRRFLLPGTSAFKVLDTQPPVFRDGAGALRGRGPSILTKGPDRLFYEKNLYTTRVLGQPNDDIERMLFGYIDTTGRAAIDAFIAEDWDKVHKTYTQLFEFLDALRLRTPKGLKFVKFVSGARDQMELMVWMQSIRQMHCVMWMEGAREIVSAENSPVKFILSDHPVTFFNRHVFPADPSIHPGQDPNLAWLGTQTIFPLDMNRLLVMTHNEWGRSPKPSHARRPRTNPRLFDENAMAWYDDCDRNRHLSENEVLEVNLILKLRCHRYIAANNDEDLFPERRLKPKLWNKLGLFLMPPEFRTSRQVGYTSIQMKDGSYFFQDEFGRRPQSSTEYQEAVDKAKQMQADFHRVMQAHLATQNGVSNEDDGAADTA